MSSTIKFANVILERNERSVGFPTLYCTADQPFVFDKEEGAWRLFDRGHFDFTTYFNSLSVMKLARYTDATRFFLHLEVKGAACTYRQTVADALSAHPEVLEETEHVFSASDDWQTLDVELTLLDGTVVAGFELTCDGPVFIQNSYYSVEIPHELRDVELALATTTFKKEEFIEHNIGLVRTEILESDEDIARHFSMHVIDNGRTLDVDRLAGGRITISPNDNVGGAGGFTRGMIEAMEQTPRATHVLLMDDDVAVSPESIKRTYNLLRMLNEEFSEAFISGAMLNYEIGDEQWEDTGFMTRQGTFAPAKPPLRYSKFEDVIYNEAFSIPKEIAKLDQRYAAWWFCCIPISVIEKNGLPLPVFVRCDDAEYGVRCKPRIITMNGLCIWHMSFHVRYNAAVERYQTTRNTMIAQATTGFAPKSDFMYEMRNNVRLELKKFGYANAELVLDAFEDFMRGPEFIGTPGVAEETFMRANRNKEKLVPFDELQRQAHELGLTQFDLVKIDRQLIDSDKPRSRVERLSDYAFDNHQRLMVNEGQGYAVIPVLGWAYPAGVIRGKKYLIVIDWYNRCGAIRAKDPVRYAAIEKRLKDDLKRYKREIEGLRKRYAAHRDEFTSVTFWKHYLGM